MGKLVIKHQGKPVGEFNLKLGDTKIGRKPGCDIVLNDPIVSGEHAVVKRVGLKATIEDLGSKNGTFIETQRVTQRELKHGETIIIGGYTLTYRADALLEPSAFGKQAAPAATAALAAHSTTTELVSFAELLGVEGKDKGKRLPLVKNTVTLDNPGRGPARIYRSANGYVLEASVGPGEPKLNDRPLPPGGQLLENGDIIDVAGTKFQFSK